MTAPNLATRLLDACENLGVDTGVWCRDSQALWCRLGTNSTRRPTQATREEIESLAFRLEGKLETMGMYRMYDEHGEVHTWIKPEQPKALVSDPDRIEAVILAAEKMGGEG